jgi:colanic acid/amylovoran biosynthesis glycosyltransferase
MNEPTANHLSKNVSTKSSKTVRVAYLINQYPKLSHTFIRREILALEAAGVEVVRIAIRADETKAVDPQDADEVARTRYVLQAGPAVIVLSCLLRALRRPQSFFRTLVRAVRLGIHSDGGVFKHIAYFIEACIVARWLERGQIEHVHAHFGTNATTVAMLAEQLSDITYSFTVHGPEEFDRPKRLALREKMHGANFVVAISSFCRSQLFRWAQFDDWAKIQIVHCGLDRSYFEGADRPVPERPRLICVGRLCEEKGQILVVRAAHLLAQRGVTFEILFAGDGPLRAPVEAEIRAHGLEDAVRILGWVDNPRVRELLLDARALVLASFAEGLPVVIMEAFALGRPVISTCIAGIPELVVNGENGWLIPAGDVERLADAMQQVVTSEPLALQSLGQSGRARTLELHEIATEAGKLKELFSMALSGAGRGGRSVAMISPASRTPTSGAPTPADPLPEVSVSER